MTIRRTLAVLILFMTATAGAARAAETAAATCQNGADGYSGCTATPDAETMRLDTDKAAELSFLFDRIGPRLRADEPRVASAKLELFYTLEWWTAYRHELSCVDAAGKVAAGPPVVIFGDRVRGKATPKKRFVAWTLAPELVQRWIDDPASNKGVTVRIAGSELLDAKMGGGKLVGFMGNATRIARYRPRLVVEYAGDIRPEAPKWKTDLARREVGGRQFNLRWTAPEEGADAFEIEMDRGRGWRRAARVTGKGRENLWSGPRSGKVRLRIRARKGGLASEWTASPEFACVRSRVPMRLGALPTTLRLRRDAPPRQTPSEKARIELARGETEGVQLVVDGAETALKNVRVSATDLTGPGGRISASDVRIRPVGYVQTKPSGIYLTERDGWFADVLLEKKSFDLDAETVQPVWISYTAPRTLKAGTYKGRIEISADGRGNSRSIPLEVTVWNFEIPREHSLGVLVHGGTNTAAWGVERGSKEVEELSLRHQRILIEHRMTPSWPLKRFSWTRANLPRKPDGSFDFTEYDKTAERLIEAGAAPRFFIALVPRLGKWGFADTLTPQWRKDFGDYVRAMAKHLDEKGWLGRAMVYNIDEASGKERPSCREMYKLVKGIDKRLTVFQTLNEPRAIREMKDHADIINVNLRQYHKAGIPKLQAAGKECWGYVCCWPNENPNLFTEYPAVDGRALGWFTWKLGLKGHVYWASMAWGEALKAGGGAKQIDEIKSDWVTRSFGRYNGDGVLFYPGPNRAILDSIRVENYRDGLEDYEYLALLKKALAGGSLAGAEAERAKKLVAVDDRICSRSFGYDLTGERMLAARREMAEILSGLADR